MKATILIFLLSTIVLAQKSRYVVILSLEDKVVVREAYSDEWKDAFVGMVLDNREAIKCGASSSAKLKSHDGRIFTLPANAQINVDELENLDRYQLVMHLTALELQKLPRKKNTPERPDAFIVHGKIANEQNGFGKVRRYIELEENGARALYSQKFIPGFILKWSSFSSFFPEHRNSELDNALIDSFEKMNLPTRKKEFMRLTQSVKRNK